MDVSSLVPAGFQGNHVDLCEIQAGYNKFSENLRKFTPQAIQCAIFCGGSRCKYENSKAWPPVHMAIQNIFSHWVTDEVLAMARPNTAQIIKKDIIAQFQGWSIKTIINLQTPGEHASCGGPLEESGFTYDPNIFMKHGIYYYNFALKDYGDATMSKLLDMVKVVAFAVQEGRVAIHCHAGLGRTGVLIACYLIYSLRVRANDAIRFVRMKRPSAIQTRGQILCIQDFEHFVLPQMIVFPLNSTIGDRKPCSLQSCLKKQHNVLHGYEQRTFKHIPKIMFVICERILQLCDCQEDNSPCEIKYTISSTPFTQKFISHILDKLRDSKGNIRHSYSWAESLADSYDYSSSMKACASGSQASSRSTSDDIGRLSDVFCTSPDTPSCDSVFPVLDDSCMDDVLGDGIHGQDLLDNDCYKEIQSHMSLKAAAQNTTLETVTTDEAIRVLIRDNATLPEKTKKRIQDYQMDLNHRSTAWQRLQMETDLDILSGLLFEWLETLKHPLLDVDSLSYIVVWSSKPERCLEKLPSCNRYLLEYILRFIIRLRPMTAENQSFITKRFIATLTQQTIWIKNAFYPSNRNFQKLRRGTAAKLNEFFIRLMNLIEEVNTQEMEKPSWSSKWDLVSTQLKEMETEVEHEISN
ncbi:protein tyrosine phosphatase domain-containing protein 1 [Apis mellifera carnica]|uniref:Protein tyrosine phosphatase domain-containing protein 1 n=1 Tax=Apis mellifera TaxID=7460 RepID=A0A7M7GM21_APIME|nr:protein tyrosine phosphatase domain-containing protein 1 [Apis mellifera]KAG9428961.1 protein tyrosine phosphatase domain-containing protein 1 [Apis mellifera carnica]|eukprot:XP_006560463.2 protein tyrosine phosphatase domain-containing protein 1 [Apis mellifera]